MLEAGDYVEVLVPGELLLHLAVPTGSQLFLEGLQLEVERGRRALALVHLVLKSIYFLPDAMQLFLLEVRELLDVVVLVLYVSERKGDLSKLVLFILIGSVLVRRVVHGGCGVELGAALVDAELARQDRPGHRVA